VEFSHGNAQVHVSVHNVEESLSNHQALYLPLDRLVAVLVVLHPLLRVAQAQVVLFRLANQQLQISFRRVCRFRSLNNNTSLVSDCTMGNHLLSQTL
jgi:hypothetical protein